MSVRLSVRIYHRGSHWTDFREIWYRIPLRKSVQKLQTLLKSDNSIGHFTWRPKYVCIDSCNGTARQQATGELCCVSLATFNGFVTDSTCTLCCVSKAVMITRIRHNVTSYVHCLSYHGFPPSLQWNEIGPYRFLPHSFTPCDSRFTIVLTFRGPR